MEQMHITMLSVGRAVEPELKFPALASAPALGILIFWFWLQHLEVFGSCFRTIWSIENQKPL